METVKELREESKSYQWEIYVNWYEAAIEWILQQIWEWLPTESIEKYLQDLLK